MDMDPLHFCIAIGPLAVYLLLLGILNLRGTPFLTTGARDAAALAIGISGTVMAGPMELFFPEAAASQFGGYVWLMLIAFYGLLVSLVVLLMRPRLVIYNITRDQLLPLLRKVVSEMDPAAKWTADSLLMPAANIHLVIESNDALRNVQLTAAGNRQSFEGWRMLERELAIALQPIRTRPNLAGFAFVFTAVVISLGTVAWMVSDAASVAQTFQEMMRW